MNVFLIIFAVNYETLTLMIKFGLAMFGILMLVWVLAVLTPKIAKFTDKFLGKIKIDNNSHSAQSNKADNAVRDNKKQVYKVYDIYEGNPIETPDNNKKND